MAEFEPTSGGSAPTGGGSAAFESSHTPAHRSQIAAKFEKHMTVAAVGSLGAAKHASTEGVQPTVKGAATVLGKMASAVLPSKFRALVKNG